jgi:hypothetical protein
VNWPTISSTEKRYWRNKTRPHSPYSLFPIPITDLNRITREGRVSRRWAKFTPI